MKRGSQHDPNSGRGAQGNERERCTPAAEQRNTPCITPLLRQRFVALKVAIDEPLIRIVNGFGLSGIELIRAVVVQEAVAFALNIRDLSKDGC